MKRVGILLTAIAISAGIGGCSSTIDADAYPQASQELAYATDICMTNFRTKKLNTANEVMDCLLGAQRHMMDEIALKDMSLFDVYAARVRLIANNVDSRQVTVEEGIAEYQGAQKQFADTIIGSMQADERHREQMRRAFAAIGSGMQHYAEANRSVSCNSTAFGNTVNTTCR